MNGWKPDRSPHAAFTNPRMTRTFVAARNDRILVTGSNGFIGAKVVEILLERGFRNLRCFVRPSSRMDRLTAVLQRFAAETSVELCSGDLMSAEDCERATAGVSVIYHLAAGFDKSFAGAFMNSALATRNLMNAFLDHLLRCAGLRLIHRVTDGGEELVVEIDFRHTAH